MKKYNVHSSRARNAISWALSLLMIVAGVALVASFFLAGRLDSTATNSDDPGGFNVPKLETTNDENTSNTGPSDKTLELTVPAMARIENDEVPYATGTDEEALKTNAAIHLEGTGFPWDNVANVYIAGHRLGYPSTESWLTFWDLNRSTRAMPSTSPTLTVPSTPTTSSRPSLSALLIPKLRIPCLARTYSPSSHARCPTTGSV